MHTADVSPTRQSVLGGSAQRAPSPPASATNRNVVTHTTPPAGPARLRRKSTLDGAEEMARPRPRAALFTRPLRGAKCALRAPSAFRQAARNSRVGTSAGNVEDSGTTVTDRKRRRPQLRRTRQGTTCRGRPAATTASARGQFEQRKQPRRRGRPRNAPRRRNRRRTLHAYNPPQAQVCGDPASGASAPAERSTQSAPSQQSAPARMRRRISNRDSSSARRVAGVSKSDCPRDRASASAPRPPAGLLLSRRTDVLGFGAIRIAGYLEWLHRREAVADRLRIVASSRSYGSQSGLQRRSSAPAYSAPHYSAPFRRQLSLLREAAAAATTAVAAEVGDTPQAVAVEAVDITVADTSGAKRSEAGRSARAALLLCCTADKFAVRLCIASPVTAEHGPVRPTAYNRRVNRPTVKSVKKVAEANFPTRWGQFRIYGFEGDFENLLDSVSRRGS